AVQSEAGKAYEKLAELKDNIALAYNLVVEGHVQHVHGHGYQVATGLAKGRKFWQVGERCDCPDAALMPQGLCAHKLATMLHIRAKQLLIDHAAGTHAQPADLTTPDVPEESKEEVLGLRIPEKYIVDIQGTMAVRYAGLLLMAHERGLVSITADWTYNDAELSLAHAIATFSDGRKFEEAGDAAPSNVTKKVAGHFRRVALTR